MMARALLSKTPLAHPEPLIALASLALSMPLPVPGLTREMRQEMKQALDKVKTFISPGDPASALDALPEVQIETFVGHVINQLEWVLHGDRTD